MIQLLAVAATSGLLTGLIHLVIVLIVIAIVYYVLIWIIGKLGAPAIISTLVGILCALIALYFVVMFLLSII